MVLQCRLREYSLSTAAVVGSSDAYRRPSALLSDVGLVRRRRIPLVGISTHYVGETALFRLFLPTDPDVGILKRWMDAYLWRHLAHLPHIGRALDWRKHHPGNYLCFRTDSGR